MYAVGDLVLRLRHADRRCRSLAAERTGNGHGTGHGGDRGCVGGGHRQWAAVGRHLTDEGLAASDEGFRRAVDSVPRAGAGAAPLQPAAILAGRHRHANRPRIDRRGRHCRHGHAASSHHL